MALGCFSFQQEQGLVDSGLTRLVRALERTWPMQVTLGEVGSCWGSLLFFLMNIGLFERDFPLLLLAALDRKNLISGGGNFSGRPGLEIVFAARFISLYLSMGFMISGFVS